MVPCPLAASAALLLLLSAACSFQQSQAWAEFLQPPPGNSPHLRVKSSNGYLTYRCTYRKWKLVSATADLVSSDGAKHLLGHYELPAKTKNIKAAGTWSLLNNPADAVESGSRFSTVSAKTILSYPNHGSLPEALFQATSHKSEGVAALVSYIQQLSPTGGVPQPWRCKQQGEQLKLPYYAEYQLWTQDALPPSVPQSLVLPAVKPVASFFGEGDVSYGVNGHVWVQKHAYANLYTVPGGTKVGSYSIKTSRTSGTVHFWNMLDPNGFRLTAKAQSPPVPVSNASLPWTSTLVVSRKGNNPLLRNVKAVQMLSTRGGLLMDSNKPRIKIAKGQLWRVHFSAVFWFYE